MSFIWREPQWRQWRVVLLCPSQVIHGHSTKFPPGCYNQFSFNRFNFFPDFSTSFIIFEEWPSQRRFYEMKIIPHRCVPRYNHCIILDIKHNMLATTKLSNMTSQPHYRKFGLNDKGSLSHIPITYIYIILLYINYIYYIILIKYIILMIMNLCVILLLLYM